MGHSILSSDVFDEMPSLADEPTFKEAGAAESPEKPVTGTSFEKLTNSFPEIHQHLARRNPARLDLTKAPVTQKHAMQLGGFHWEVYDRYHRYTNFELDMVYCTNGCFTGGLSDSGIQIFEEFNDESGTKGIEDKDIFYPSMLLSDSSHKRSIRKLAIRFMLKDHENKCPNPNGFPRTLGARERIWMKRTLENIPSFTNLESLDLNITFDHKSPKTLEWDEEGNCLWKEYQQSLIYCLDRLTKLKRLRVTTIGPPTTIIKWLEARYGFLPTIHKHDKYCHHFEFSPEITRNMPETTVYEWKAKPKHSLEFEKEDEDESDGGEWWDDEYLGITLPETGVQREELGFEEMLERTEVELFGYDGFAGWYEMEFGKDTGGPDFLDRLVHRIQEN